MPSMALEALRKSRMQRIEESRGWIVLLGHLLYWDGMSVRMEGNACAWFLMHEAEKLGWSDGRIVKADQKAEVKVMTVAVVVDGNG